MPTSNKIIVKELVRNENTRTTIIEAGAKLIQTPCYMAKMRSSDELNIFCNEPHQFENIQGIYFDIYNVENIIKLREANQIRKTLFGIERDENYLFVKNNFAFFIDPCTEYFYFSSPKREKYLKINGLPHYVKNLLISNTETHLQNWKKIKDDNEIANLIKWYIKHCSTNLADVIIPPVPIIDGESNDLLDIAFEINKNTLLLSNKPSSIYFLLNFKIFRNTPSYLEKIIEFLWENENELKDANLIFIKIKNYDFNGNGILRERLKRFLLAMSDSARSLGKALFLLDADSLGFVSLFCGVDGYVEPMDANIREQRGESSPLSYMGKYYNPAKLDFWGYSDVLDYFKIHKSLPCNCPVCASINKSSLPKNKDEWNSKRRAHLLHSRNSELKEVNHSINNNYVRGIVDKVSHSNYKNYLDLIPNGF